MDWWLFIGPFKEKNLVPSRWWGNQCWSLGPSWHSWRCCGQWTLWWPFSPVPGTLPLSPPTAAGHTVLSHWSLLAKWSLSKFYHFLSIIMNLLVCGFDFLFHYFTLFLRGNIGSSLGSQQSYISCNMVILIMNITPSLQLRRIPPCTLSWEI